MIELARHAVEVDEVEAGCPRRDRRTSQNWCWNWCWPLECRCGWRLGLAADERDENDCKKKGSGVFSEPLRTRCPSIPQTNVRSGSEKYSRPLFLQSFSSRSSAARPNLPPTPALQRPTPVPTPVLTGSWTALRKAGSTSSTSTACPASSTTPRSCRPASALLDYDNDGDLDVYLVQGRMLGDKASTRRVRRQRGRSRTGCIATIWRSGPMARARCGSPT